DPARTVDRRAMPALAAHGEARTRRSSPEAVAARRFGRLFPDLHIEHTLAALGNGDVEVRPVGDQAVGRLRERYDRRAPQPVKSLIAERDGAAFSLGGMGNPTLGPGRAAHLEH